jgi:uncharacterized protein YkwD
LTSLGNDLEYPGFVELVVEFPMIMSPATQSRFLHGFTFLHKNYITKRKNTQNQSKQKRTSNQENNIKKKNKEMNQQRKLWEVQGVDSSSQFFFWRICF